MERLDVFWQATVESLVLQVSVKQVVSLLVEVACFICVEIRVLVERAQQAVNIMHYLSCVDDLLRFHHLFVHLQSQVVMKQLDLSQVLSFSAYQCNILRNGNAVDSNRLDDLIFSYWPSFHYLFNYKSLIKLRKLTL